LRRRNCVKDVKEEENVKREAHVAASVIRREVMSRV
jgi:hypothetical protein